MSAPLPYRLRLPGPTAVPERIRQAMAALVVNHRGPEFHDCFAEVQRRLRPVFGAARDALLFAASGTGVMEAAVVNFVAPGDPVLVVSHGQFGERFKAIAEAYGARVDLYDVEWGDAPDPAEIGRRLKAKDYRAVFVTHNESSTGAVADLAAIGALTRDRSALLIVDAVSSAAGIELRQDEWGVDVLVTASQKALMCPPGLGLVSLSEKAWAALERPGAPRFFWDFARARGALQKAETAFTPPVSLVFALREALRMIGEEGLPHVLERHQRLAAAFRAGAQATGLELFTRAPSLSSTVVVLSAPAGIEGGAIVRHLYERYRMVVAGARNRLAGKVVRFGTMGANTAPDILADLFYLERTLQELGVSVRAGAGVAAAAAALDGG
jgi:aspartate aminotransferase-like enzyme